MLVATDTGTTRCVAQKAIKSLLAHTVNRELSHKQSIIGSTPIVGTRLWHVNMKMRKHQ